MPRRAPAAADKGRLLRQILASAGFDAASASALLGPADARLSTDEQEALWLHRASGPGPLSLVVRLFVLGETLPARQARLLLQERLEPALATGIVRQRRDRRIEAALTLSLHDGLAIFADPPMHDPAPETVPGPTRASLVLARALPASPVGATLDLGTGSGLLALLLAARGSRVTASDVSPRALALAALNAALNRQSGIRFVRSDRFARLGRARFALIVGNLPFVVAPHRRYTYRDADRPEDGFLAAVVQEAGRHLASGGFGLFLGQWVHKREEDEFSRLAPWLHHAGCDGLVYRLDADTPDVHAARWSTGPRLGVDRIARAREIGRWVAELERSGILAISTGLFVLRKRASRRHVMSIDDVPADAPPPDWPTIRARFAAIDTEGA